MKIINVVRAFTLNLKGKAIQFAKGVHTVEAEIADHWLVQMYSTVVSEVKTEAAKVETAVKTAAQTVAADAAKVVDAVRAKK